jgi:hypothetical protein
MSELNIEVPHNLYEERDDHLDGFYQKSSLLKQISVDIFALNGDNQMVSHPGSFQSTIQVF